MAKSVKTTRKLRVNSQLWGRGTSFRAARTSPASTMLRDALKTSEIIHLFLKSRAERGIHTATMIIPEIPSGARNPYCNDDHS
jgi:hypothetical protein